MTNPSVYQMSPEKAEEVDLTIVPWIMWLNDHREEFGKDPASQHAEVMLSIFVMSNWAIEVGMARWGAATPKYAQLVHG